MEITEWVRNIYESHCQQIQFITRRSIHLLPLIQFRVIGELEPIQAVTGERQGTPSHSQMQIQIQTCKEQTIHKYTPDTSLPLQAVSNKI